MKNTFIVGIIVLLLSQAYCFAQTTQASNSPYSWLTPIQPQAVQTTDLNLAFQLGVTAFNKGDLKNALFQFENVVKYQPNDVGALSYLGLIYYNLGSAEASIDSFNKILQLDPNRKDVYYNLGLSYLQNEDFKNALQSFEEAQRLLGDKPDILYRIALAYFKSGEIDKAITHLKDLIEKNPDFGIDPYFTLALSYYYKGMADEAQGMFNNVVKMAPDDTNWDKSAREYIEKIEGIKTQKPQDLSFSIYTNYENDSNVAYSAAPTPSDADKKITIYSSLNYKPSFFGKNQPFKIGYSYYALQYAAHPTQNLAGHMIESSYTMLFSQSLLVLKANINGYVLGGMPYLANIPIDLRYTFKVLPWQGTWSILYGTYAIDMYPHPTYQNQNAGSMVFGLKQFINDQLNVAYEMKTLNAKGATSATTFLRVDDYSYSSNQISFGYIQPLPGDFSLSVDGSFSNKNYLNPDSSSTPATKRTDQITSLSASLSKTIFWGMGLILKMSSYSDTSNLTATTSALAYGSYSSSAMSIGLTKAF